MVSDHITESQQPQAMLLSYTQGRDMKKKIWDINWYDVIYRRRDNSIIDYESADIRQRTYAWNPYLAISVPLKFRLGVARGHWKWYQSVAWLCSISVNNLCRKTHRSATIHDRDNDTCIAICAFTAFTVRDAPNKKLEDDWTTTKETDSCYQERTQ